MDVFMQLSNHPSFSRFSAACDRLLKLIMIILILVAPDLASVKADNMDLFPMVKSCA